MNIKSILISIFLTLSLTTYIHASGSIVGVLTTPNTSIPISNATFTFNLSQAGITIDNSYALTTTPINCYTGNTGSVVGLPDPIVQAIATPQVGVGSLAGNYYVRIAYYNGSTYSAPSPSLLVNVGGSNNSIIVLQPNLKPANASGFKVYMGTVAGSETYQQTVVGVLNTATLNTYTVGAALPINNSVCSFTFNDAIIPVGTNYQVNVITSNGNKVSGYPQTWHLSGSIINISSIYPIAGTSQVRYANPILSTPLSNYATQSINSDLTLNNFKLTTIGSITLVPVLFNALPACTGSTEGRVYSITDSSTIIWGAIVTGGSTGHIMAYCDGSNYTVMGK